MKPSVHTIGRRAFLTGLGATALSLPFLPSLHAQQSGRPLRLVVVYHGLGTMIDQWTPGNTGALGALPPLLAPLDAYRDQMLVLSGIENRLIHSIVPGEISHAAAAYTMLTGQPMSGMLDANGNLRPDADIIDGTPPVGPSFDQWLAERISTDPGLRRSINLAVGHDFAGEYVAFWRTQGAGTVRVENDADPQAAFDSIFGNFVPPDPNQTPSFRQRMRQRSGSILDAVSDSYARLEQSVPADEREILQNHAQMIRELEQNLDIEIDLTGSCAIPSLNLPAGFTYYEDEWQTRAAQNQMDILTMSLACDITRVATLQFTRTHDARFSEIPNYTIPAPGFTDWHAMVHNDSGSPLGDGLFQGYEFYSHQMADLLRRLSTTPDGDGTLLDNTVVLWMSEFGDGGGHTVQDLPVVMFGGPLQKGRHLDCSGRTTQELYAGIAERFGSNETTFGMTNYQGTPLTANPIDLS